MQAGLIARYESLEFRLSLSLSGSGIAIGELTCTHLPNRTSPLQTDLQVTLSRSTSDDLTSASVLLYNPNTSSLETIWYDSASGMPNWEIVVRLVDFRVHVRFVSGAPRWEVRAQRLEIVRSGVLVYTLDLQTRVYASLYFAPAGLPFLGLPPLMKGAGDHAGNGNSVSGAAQGGWRVRQGGAPIAFPVRVAAGAAWQASDFPCSDCTPSFDPPSASDTWNADVPYSSFASATTSSGTNGDCSWERVIGTASSKQSQIWLLPDLPRAYLSLSAAPQSAIVHRLAQPNVDRISDYISRRWVYRNASPCRYEQSCDTPLTVSERVYSERAAAVERVDPPLNLEPSQLYAPFLMSAGCSYSVVLRLSIDCDPCNLPISTPDAYDATATRFFPFVPDSITGYYEPSTGDTTTDWVVRYLHAWAHPHWSHFLWWADWSLGEPLQPAPYLDYWLPLQQQWLGDPNLPESQRTRERNQCLLEPLTVSPYTDWIADTLIGYPTLWVGASRFDVLPLPDVGQRQLTAASQPRWAASGATLTFNPGSIAVSPSSATHTLEFDLTDWQVPPYLYPVLADSVRIAVSDPNAEVRVYLVDFAGETVLLDPHPSDSTRYPYRASAESIYAGSWAQSYAANLSGYSETGQDLLPAGRSALVMGDNARRTVWEMLGSRTPSKLRIVVSQDSPTDYTLEYPTFYRDTPSVSCAYPETAHTQAVVRGEQLWRHGGLEFLLTTPVPNLRPPHTSPTVYDALCLQNLLYRGVAFQTDMFAIASTLYDVNEWDTSFAELRTATRALIRPLRQRTNSEPQWVLINAWREVPPLACLPRRRRDIDTLAENGDWGQWSYVLSPIRRYIVNPENYLHLHRVEYDSGGNETARTQLTTALATVGRYHITAHAQALENDEVITDWSGQQVQSPRYLFHLNGRDYARATPFHGYSAVIVLIQGSPASAIEVDGRRAWLAWSRGAQLQTHHRVDYTQWLTRDYPAPILWLAWDSRRGVYLISLLDGSDGVVFSTADGGATYTEVLRMTATRLVAESHSITGVWVALAHNGTATLRRISLDGGASWSAPTQPMLDGQPMTAVPYALAYDERSHALLLTAEQDDEWFVAVSYDLGATWSTVLT